VRVYSTPLFVLPLPTGHRFPMARYQLLYDKVCQLEGLELVVPAPVAIDDLLRVHQADYVRRALDGRLDKMELRRLGFPWSPHLVQRSLCSVGATVEAAFWAWEHKGVAVNLAGGTHHAFADRGEGFCLFNDCVVAARSWQEQVGRIGQVVFIDCDVHQGNGTASLCDGDASLFTLSLHGRNNYPFHKETSDLDLELPDGCQDDEYLQRLQEGLAQLPKADLAFYLAGADPYEKDRLGRLKLTREGLRRRDRMVLDRCRQAGTPVVVTMAGGYAEPIDDTAEIQAATVAEALRSYSSR